MNDIIAEQAETIFDTWVIYRKVIEHNYMSHQEIYGDVLETLRSTTPGFRLLDLGCGDASTFSGILKELPIEAYTGVDLSATALALAANNLANLPCSMHLQQGDLLEALYLPDQSYDVIFTSFAVHHLSLEQKSRWFELAYRCLKKPGLVLMIDVMREEGQDLPQYLQTYCLQILQHWQGLDAPEREILSRHVADYDLPEMPSTLQQLAKQAGFSDYRLISQYSAHHVVCFTAT